MEMAEGEGTNEEEEYDVDIATTASSLSGSGVFHIINDIIAFVLYMHQQIPSVLQDMSFDYDGLQTELTDLEASLTEREVKPLVRRKLVSRKREVKHEIKKMDKLMKTISSLRIALQLMIREAPPGTIQRVVLILGGSPSRPQKAYELSLLTHSDYNGLSYEGDDDDFARSRAIEALSKKTIRALISTGAGSTSCPGPMRLFVLVYAPTSVNFPQHFLPKRDFKYNRKFVPLKLRFKCRTQENATNSSTNDLMWFQCRHVIQGLAFQQPVEE